MLHTQSIGRASLEVTSRVWASSAQLPGPGVRLCKALISPAPWEQAIVGPRWCQPSEHQARDSAVLGSRAQGLAPGAVKQVLFKNGVSATSKIFLSAKATLTIKVQNLRSCLNLLGGEIVTDLQPSKPSVAVEASGRPVWLTVVQLDGLWAPPGSGKECKQWKTPTHPAPSSQKRRRGGA